MLGKLNGATRLFPIVGDPVAQVKAPAGLTHAFEQRGVDAVCVAMQISPADWQTYISAIRATKNIDGLIVTVPHKFAAYDVCDSVSDRARFLRTVNVMRRDKNGKFHGDMFDGLGFVDACKNNGCIFKGRSALLIGTGGAGTAIAHAVATEGVSELGLCDLDIKRRDDLLSRLSASGFSVHAADNDASRYDIILNATPLGMREDDPLPVITGSLRAGQFVGDVVTKPEITALISTASAMGLPTSNGIAMFEKVRDLLVDFLLSPDVCQSGHPILEPD
jgi:shikimate dehydrogenase